MNAIVASELNYCFMQGIKPNFSELSRKYDIDRHTLKKHYESGGQKQRKKRKYSSKLNKYYDVIVDKLKISGITYIGIYQLLIDRYSYKGSYSLLKNYIMKKGLRLSDRIFKCECGLIIDRDLNASLNLSRYIR